MTNERNVHKRMLLLQQGNQATKYDILEEIIEFGGCWGRNMQNLLEKALKYGAIWPGNTWPGTDRVLETLIDNYDYMTFTWAIDNKCPIEANSILKASQKKYPRFLVYIIKSLYSRM